MNEPHAPFRRLLLALETTGQDEAFFRSAAELAANLGIELSGLLVEDEDLMRMGELPVARQFNVLEGSLRPFAPGSLEREVRSELAQTRERLSRACERMGIAHSLRAVRGRPGPVIEEAAEDADLLVVAGTARPLSRRLEIRSTTLRAALTSQRSVLVLQRGGFSTSDWLVPYDGSEASKRALTVALRLAGRDGREITALLPAENNEALRGEVLAALPESGVRTQFITITPSSAEALAALLRRVPRGTLVLGAGSSLLDGESADRLIAAAPGAVLLVRGG